MSGSLGGLLGQSGTVGLGGLLNQPPHPLAITPPPEAGPNTNLAGAVTQTAQAVSDWIAQQQQQSAAAGLWDTARGMPTAAGWQQAGQAIASGLGPSDIGLLAGIKGFHASPQAGLEMLNALRPPARQFDNATSQFGTFMAPSQGGAARYGANMYTGEMPENLYEMPYSDFAYFQSPHKGPNGESLPGEQWDARAEQLKQEAAALRDKLQSQGYGGIKVTTPKGNIAEMASFSDVPVQPVQGKP